MEVTSPWFDAGDRREFVLQETPECVQRVPRVLDVIGVDFDVFTETAELLYADGGLLNGSQPSKSSSQTGPRRSIRSFDRS